MTTLAELVKELHPFTDSIFFLSLLLHLPNYIPPLPLSYQELDVAWLNLLMAWDRKRGKYTLITLNIGIH